MTRYSLVMVETPLVAHDLALMLEDLTGAACMTSAAMDEACEKLASLQPGSLLYAFVQSDLKSLALSTLPDLVRALGGRLILIGHSAELEAAAHADGNAPPVLIQPFGAAQVTEVLSKIAIEEPGGGAAACP
jgi:hypothetical protein